MSSTSPTLSSQWLQSRSSWETQRGISMPMLKGLTWAQSISTIDRALRIRTTTTQSWTRLISLQSLNLQQNERKQVCAKVRRLKLHQSAKKSIMGLQVVARISVRYSIMASLRQQTMCLHRKIFESKVVVSWVKTPFCRHCRPSKCRIKLGRHQFSKVLSYHK